jgi:UTP--glucose-1-phosphate uridylyltransferase
VDIVEKPQPAEAPSSFAVASRYVFNPIIFDMIERIEPGVAGELQLTDAIRLLLREGHPVWCVRLAPDETRYDIGNFESYFRAFFDMALNDPEVGEKMKAYLRAQLER